jgi:hypothetical protein
VKLPSDGVRARRQFCRETWGHDWYDVDDEVKDARKHVARALLSGAAPEEASHALAGDVQEARMQTASKAQQAAEAAAKREKAAAKREKAQLKADKEFGDGEVNLHLWADLIGKTWEWRKEARMLNSEWRTIELASDHRCVLREGVKREVKSEEVLYWHVCSNAKDFGSNAGSLALLGTPPHRMAMVSRSLSNTSAGKRLRRRTPPRSMLHCIS